MVISTKLNYPLLLIKHLFSDAHWGEIAAALSAVLARWPDAVVHLEGIGLVPLVSGLSSQSVVVTTTDAWSLRQHRLAARARSWRLRWFLKAYAALSAWVERRYFPLAGAVQVVSPVDAAYLRHAVPAARVHVIPIALSSQPDLRPVRSTVPMGEPRTVLFWGDIRVAHIADGLKWLLHEVMPLVEPKARWVVLGRHAPEAALQAMAPVVQFVNWVEDVDRFLQAADVVVLPDAEGTGLKNRAVHAMACGVPVVGTPSAFEGLAVTDEVEAMVKADAVQFADGVSRLLVDAGLSERMGQSGRQFAIEGYSIEAVGKCWSELYASVTPRSAATP